MTRQKPRPSPYRWLWAEIERRYGADVAKDIKDGYAAQHRAYQHAVWHDVESPTGSLLKPWDHRKREKKRGS